MNNQIYFFTNTGLTAHIAKKLSEKTDGELIRLRDNISYKGIFGFIKAAFYSLIKKRVKLASYKPIVSERIFIGSPVWAGSITPAVRSFIEENNFDGINITPFITLASKQYEKPLRVLIDLIKKRNGKIKDPFYIVTHKKSFSDIAEEVETKINVS